MKAHKESDLVRKPSNRIFSLCHLSVFVFLLIAIPSSTKAQIRVMSYNIHYCVGMDKKNSMQGIAELIRKVDPDIVGLQEISDSLMAHEIGRLTGMRAVFGPSLGKMNGYGDAILSKYPFEWESNHSIPSASSSRYQAMAVTIDFSAKSKDIGKIRLINTHFDWLTTIGSKHARLATVDVIEEAFFTNQSIPTILTGDLNAVPDSEVIEKLKSYGWINCSEGGTYKTISSDNPTRQIDYIFYRAREKWKVKKFWVMYGELSSDHLPVVAELTVK